MRNTISFNTKFGWISATEINNKITKIQFGRKKGLGKKSKNLVNLKKKIISFFQKKTNKLDAKILFNGNFLQKKIWLELKKIKKGKVKTYGEIAKKLKISPRYVGRVCGENNHLLVVPCHRIIRSDNTLGGFSTPGGIKLKKKLLEFEGIFI
tara:strand:+ start:518 stop:973 length:456 start_codon:yes stop_codon:yes gene_type:complete